MTIGQPAVQHTGAAATVAAPQPRHDWTREEVRALFEQPFADLLFRAQATHRAHFDPNRVQVATLLSVKTGACPEDCAYCPQSARYDTGLQREAIMDPEAVADAARRAADAGATRFCMGAAWRRPKERDIEALAELIRTVRALGMETCVTAGMLSAEQAQRLKDEGLDYYNHNLDTSPEYYPQIITTRSYQDRLDTLEHLRQAGIGVCCGGIVGMGESREDRVGLLTELATLPEHPGSVPINQLVQVPGTPLYGTEALDPLELVRTVAVARILMPRAMVRLAAGRTAMSDEQQAWCFFAGANSIFYGDKLLTTDNPEAEADRALMERLGMQPMSQPPASPAADGTGHDG